MNFRLRMALVFTLLVGVLLSLFGFLFLRRSEALREAEFFERLEERSVLVEQILLRSRALPEVEAEHLEQLLLEALPDEAVLVLGTDGSVLFARSASANDLPGSWREVAEREVVFRITRGRRQYVVVDRPSVVREGIRVTMTSAVDEQGLRSVAALRQWVVGAGLLALALTAFVAWWYATWALAPVRSLVQQVGEVHEPSERLPVAEGGKPDELAEIAIAFNDLLSRLDEAFQVQRSFIATASHELRTPLTVVRGELHQAMLDMKDQSGAMKNLKVVEEQAVHMQDLLTQLLWLARTRGATSDLVKDHVRLDEVAERAMERCRMRYPEVPVRFAMAIGEHDEDPEVRGNAVLLTAAIYNLLTNAAKYGGGGHVDLQVGVDGGTVSCRITDQGPGMDAATLGRSRELFFRAADAPALDGHGIGLSLVERVARVHGGKVVITSGPGQGTKVELLLPVLRREHV